MLKAWRVELANCIQIPLETIGVNFISILLEKAYSATGKALEMQKCSDEELLFAAGTDY